MRYTTILFLILSLLVTAVTGQSGGKTTKTPKGPAAVGSSLGATVEKYVTHTDINADGTASETLEMQRRCTTNQCIELLSNYKALFNSDLHRMKVVDAYLVKAAGNIVKIPPTDITDLPTAQSEAAPGFSSLRELTIKFANWRIGDAAYFRIEGATKKPIIDRRYDSLDLFPLLFEWKSIEINVSAPTGFEIFTEAVGLEGGKLADENGRSRWRFTRSNIPNIDLEPLVNPFGVSPRFSLTTFRSPDELGSAFWEIIRPKTVVTPELQKLADEITRDARTPAEQATAIYDWTNRNIRYLFIVLDRSGWVPHEADQIVRNGYGDCKDYTVLIHTLLKAKGIESIPVLIRSELGSWFPAVPTMEYFNHAILYIPSLKLFADATVPNTRLGLIPQTIVGKKAILAGEKTGIIDVPKDDPSGSQILSDVTFRFSENGDVKAQTKNTYVGRTEIVFRPLFSDTFGRDPTTIVKLLLAFAGIDGNGKIVKVGSPHQLGEPFSVELESDIKEFTTFSPTGKLTLPIGLNLVNLGEMAQLATTDIRKTSVEVGAVTIRESITVELPAAVRIVGAPKEFELVTSAGRFSVKPEVKDGRVHLVRQLVILKDAIEPAEYPQFKQLVDAISSRNALEFEYTADPSLSAARNGRKKKNTKVPQKSVGDRVVEALLGPDPGKPLKSDEVRQLEARLVSNADDVDSREKLLRHYGDYQTKRTPAVEAAFLKHRLWMINNRPDISENAIFGWFVPDMDAKSREVIRDAWLAAVEKTKHDAVVLLNAVESLRRDFRAEAEKLLVEGIRRHPNNYKFPLLLTEVISQGLTKNTTEEQKKVLGGKVVESGGVALTLIKKERSMTRDNDRKDLLKLLSSAAIAAGELDSAAAFATELILDFGQSVEDHDFDDVSHLGNTALGRVELRRGNLDSAKEYLLVSIRAPLRKPKSSLLEIDLRLARELYDKGVRDEVAEFLRLCLSLGEYNPPQDHNKDEIKTLKRWLTLIANGIRPSFDFTEP